MRLLVERQRLIIYRKVGTFNYCFIRVNDYMLIFVMVFVSSFGRCSVRNMMASYRRILCRGTRFHGAKLSTKLIKKNSKQQFYCGVYLLRRAKVTHYIDRIWVRVYTVFSFFVFKFVNEKRITNSFFVFKFGKRKTKNEKRIPFSFFVFKFANEKRITNSFFVFRFQILKTKNKKLIRFSFLHLGCFGRTVTSGGR